MWKSVKDYVLKFFDWSNGTPSRHQEFNNILISLSDHIQFKSIVEETFFKRSVNVLESDLEKVDSFNKRKEFYDYLNLFIPFIQRFFNEEEIRFGNLSALTMVELYEHANESVRLWLEKIRFFQALYFNSQSSELHLLEFPDLIRVLDNPDIKLVRPQLLKVLIQLSPKTLKGFHEEFGNVPDLANACQKFIKKELNWSSSRSIGCFKTLSEFNYPPFDTVIMQWINWDESTTFYNFELKWQIDNHYQLDFLEIIEKQFNSNLLKIEPSDHRTVWREQFHTMYNLVARKRCLLVLETMVNWLFTHLGKPCHEDCKVRLS